MAATSNVFASAIDQAFGGFINYPSDTIKMALLTASATPNLGTWVHYSDLTNEVASGSGYTTGGVTLGTKTHTTTVANSWSVSAAISTAYNVGDVVRPSTGNTWLYVCVVAGTSSGTAPTWPTVVGATVTDGSVTWANVGESATVYSSAAASWTSATFSAAYGAIYDSTSGVGTTEPLIALVNFGTTLSPSAGTLTVTPNSSTGWFATFPA